jgi:pyruvate/2-oxoglutarate dehydrogenase complex dihydrolipoamide dehydrogenase (E3) component
LTAWRARGSSPKNEAQVRAAVRPTLVGVMPTRRVGRAKERGETNGFMKVLVNAQTEAILGASMLHIEGDETVHSLLNVMAAGASYRVVQRAMHIHLTVSELIPTLLGQLVPMAPTKDTTSRNRIIR